MRILHACSLCLRIVLWFHTSFSPSTSKIILGFVAYIVSCMKRDLRNADVSSIWLFKSTIRHREEEWSNWSAMFSTLRGGHTALCGLITAKTRPKVVSREADDVVRIGVEFKTSYGRFVDVAGRGKKFWTAQNFIPRTTMGGTHGKVKTCNTRETYVIIRVPAVIEPWGDAVRRESFWTRFGRD